MAIVIKADTAGISKALLWAAAIRGSLPRNLANAMQTTGYAVRDDLRNRTPGYLNASGQPTPFTMRGIFSTRVQADELRLRMGFRDEATKGTPPARYLQAQVAGGPRKPKPHENQLRRSGLLRQGQFLVPTGAYPLELNEYGNLSGGQYTQVLSRLKALGQQGYTANASGSSRSRAKRGGTAGRDFYLGFHQGKPGIHARVGALPKGTGGKGSAKGGRPVTSNLKRGYHTVFYITGQPKYARRFPAESVMFKEFNEQFPRKFTEIVVKSLTKYNKLS